MMSLLEKWIPGLGPENAWMVQIFVVVLLTALVSFVIKRVLQKISRRVSLTDNRWDDVVFVAMARPITWIIWIVGIGLAADLVLLETGSAIFEYTDAVRDVGVMLCITWSILGIIRGIERMYIETSDQIPPPEEIATIYGFESAEAMEADWIEFIRSTKFK